MLLRMTELKGSNGQISFDGSTVTITRKGFGAAIWSGGFGAVKTLPISAITGVQFKKSGLLLGYLQLTVPGELSAKKQNRTQSLLQDENTITFYAKKNEEFKALAAELQAVLSAGSSSGMPDAADQLKKLAELRNIGVLTDAEFDGKKADLLTRM